MAYIYRYTDRSDNIIKYVGIVWSESRTLSQRIAEHSAERKFKGHDWIIEYKYVPSMTRTDAEYMEAHYIALYHTDRYLNSSKQAWGVSRFIPTDEVGWERYEKKSEHRGTSNRGRLEEIKIRRDDFAQTRPESLEMILNGKFLRVFHYWHDDSFGIEFRDDSGSTIMDYPLKGETRSNARELMENSLDIVANGENDHCTGLFNKLTESYRFPLINPSKTQKLYLT